MNGERATGGGWFPANGSTTAREHSGLAHSLLCKWAAARFALRRKRAAQVQVRVKTWLLSLPGQASVNLNDSRSHIAPDLAEGGAIEASLDR